MRHIKTMALGLALAALPLAGFSGQQVQAQNTTVVKSHSQYRSQMLLDDKISVDFKQMKLERVLDYMAVVSGRSFFVNWRALEMTGITPDTPVTLRLDNVTLSKALISIMAAIEDPGNRLAIHVDRDLTEVSTLEIMNKRTTIRVYNIKDLTASYSTKVDPPEFSLSAGVGGDSSGGGLFNDPGDGEEVDQEEQAERLMELIRSLVSPELWEENGGEAASMRLHQGMLIVRAPFYLQQELGGTPMSNRSLKRRGWNMP